MSLEMPCAEVKCRSSKKIEGVYRGTGEKFHLVKIIIMLMIIYPFLKFNYGEYQSENPFALSYIYNIKNDFIIVIGK